MLSKEDKLEITQRILESSTFKNAPTSIAILKYLVDADIESRELKESIIDLEFFNSSPNTDNANPRVRVNIYNLRKKLKDYYSKEGQSEKWQLIIDKGQYGVRFEGKKQIKHHGTPGLTRLIPYILLAIVTLFIIFNTLPPTPPRIWHSFFNNGKETRLYIGDAYGFIGNTISGNRGWTRDFSINSTDEFYAMKENNPELKEHVESTELRYATRMAENATHALTKLFSKYDQDFEIKYATTSSFDDLKEGNIIYAGRSFNQPNFVYLFNEGNPFIQIEGRQLIINDAPNYPDTIINIPSSGKEFDLAIISRLPGPNNSEQFLFFSEHDIGVMATTKMFCNEEAVESFSQKHLDDTPFFTALFMVKGQERVNLKLKELKVFPL